MVGVFGHGGSEYNPWGPQSSGKELFAGEYSARVVGVTRLPSQTAPWDRDLGPDPTGAGLPSQTPDLGNEASSSFQVKTPPLAVSVSIALPSVSLSKHKTSSVGKRPIGAKQRACAATGASVAINTKSISASTTSANTIGTSPIGVSATAKPIGAAPAPMQSAPVPLVFHQMLSPLAPVPPAPLPLVPVPAVPLPAAPLPLLVPVPLAWVSPVPMQLAPMPLALVPPLVLTMVAPQDSCPYRFYSRRSIVWASGPGVPSSCWRGTVPWWSHQGNPRLLTEMRI